MVNTPRKFVNEEAGLTGDILIAQLNESLLEFLTWSNIKLSELVACSDPNAPDTRDVKTVYEEEESRPYLTATTAFLGKVDDEELKRLCLIINVEPKGRVFFLNPTPPNRINKFWVSKLMLNPTKVGRFGLNLSGELIISYDELYEKSVPTKRTEAKRYASQSNAATYVA